MLMLLLPWLRLELLLFEEDNFKEDTLRVGGEVRDPTDMLPKEEEEEEDNLVFFISEE